MFRSIGIVTCACGDNEYLAAGQRKKGWTFAYIGANQDSVEVAREMNIANAMNFTASAEGTMEMSAKLNRSRERHYDRIIECPV